MQRYNPNKAQNPTKWLALDETERNKLVEQFHKKHGGYGESLTTHCTIHAIVETQLAENTQPVMDALKRLENEELKRHEAIHAIGSVLAECIYEILHDDKADGDVNAEYYERLSTLTKSSWHEHYLDE